jgi:hypothetical protein
MAKNHRFSTNRLPSLCPSTSIRRLLSPAPNCVCDKIRSGAEPTAFEFPQSRKNCFAIVLPLLRSKKRRFRRFSAYRNVLNCALAIRAVLGIRKNPINEYRRFSRSEKGQLDPDARSDPRNPVLSILGKVRVHVPFRGVCSLYRRL